MVAPVYTLHRTPACLYASPSLTPSDICNHHVATCIMITPKVSLVRAQRKAYRPQSGLIPVVSPPDLLSPSVAYVKDHG